MRDRAGWGHRGATRPQRWSWRLRPHDDEFEDVRYAEFTFADGVTHRVPVASEQARRRVEGKQAIAYDTKTGEPSVGDDGRMIEEHENTMKKEDEGA